MCGRFSLVADTDELAERFQFDGAGLTYAPGYNIAPTQIALTVKNGDTRHASFLRWGLIPAWAKSPSLGSRMINARAETVAEKPSFRTALRQRRCLVLADGFYEWQRTEGLRRPMRITLKSREPFTLAGLWDTWRDPKGDIVTSCTIITTLANDLLSPVDDRMPVILPRDIESFWLDLHIQDLVTLSDVLTPYPSAAMEAHEVTSLVNSPSNNGPEVLVPVGRGI